MIMGIWVISTWELLKTKQLQITVYKFFFNGHVIVYKHMVFWIDTWSEI